MQVVGKIAESDSFVALRPRFAKAFAFLKRKDLAKLPCGRYEIDGNDCWASVQEVELHPYEGARLEAHRAFIDIHAPLSGPETFGVAEMSDSDLARPFDGEKDFVLFEGPMRPVTLSPGDFAVFFPPRDAHAPCCSAEGGGRLRKVVVKLRAE